MCVETGWLNDGDEDRYPVWLGNGKLPLGHAAGLLSGVGCGGYCEEKLLDFTGLPLMRTVFGGWSEVDLCLPSSLESTI